MGFMGACGSSLLALLLLSGRLSVRLSLLGFVIVCVVVARCHSSVPYGIYRCVLRP